MFNFVFPLNSPLNQQIMFLEPLEITSVLPK